eukprot:6187284-Pleurochrysis_carterae.AAC.1
MLCPRSVQHIFHRRTAVRSHYDALLKLMLHTAVGGRPSLPPLASNPALKMAAPLLPGNLAPAGAAAAEDGHYRQAAARAGVTRG